MLDRMPSKIMAIEKDDKLLGKRELKMIKKHKKRTLQLAARKRLAEALGPQVLKAVVPACVKVMKQNFTDPEIVDLYNLNLDRDYVALDCEFVTTRKGQCLGSVAIVNYSGETIYYSHSKPADVVTDYKTPWSGVREADLVDAPSFKSVRSRVLSIIKGKVVIGHAVYNDFGVLEINHPRHLIVDTSALPWIRKRALSNQERGRSLKKLSQSLLGMEIQTGEHCPLEDAKATMFLFRLVDEDWKEYIQYKHSEYMRGLLNHKGWNNI